MVLASYMSSLLSQRGVPGVSDLKSAPRTFSISLENVTFGEVTVPPVSEDGLLVLSGDTGASAAGLASVGGRGLASTSPLVGGLSAEDGLSVLVTGVLGEGSEEGGTSIVVGVASVEGVGGAESSGSLGTSCVRIVIFTIIKHAY